MWTIVTGTLFLAITRAIMPPKRMTPATYLVVYSDGTCGERIMLPVEIEGWVVRCNNDTRRILRIIDTKGNIVWGETLPDFGG
jgi:hypothetical protein